MNSSDNHENRMPETLQASTPLILCICATVIGTVALLSNATDSVKISFAGAVATGFGAAAGLARSPQDKAGVKEITRADNVDVKL